ncbi:unnamed protein product [Leptidea sinapis]|uniref:BCL2/adenovirus E1B 19 kDa protein-interacting protein 3 n=1 Tax=Leptidea sinapis TaxID=189913 RepID=A0A5E4QL17_9NEOP|nr:unnamed protein product [Leptidea sinapis]
MYEACVPTDEPESWVELNSVGAENEYIRLLREAQRESRDSSVRHSRASSMKGSPKSPPNSPNLEPMMPTTGFWSSRSLRQSCSSRGAIAAVLVTNIVSLLLGAGIGVWLSKKGV